MSEIYKYEEARESTLKYFNGDELAATVATTKYLLKNANGEFLEKNPDDMFKNRLTPEFSRIENKYKNPLSADEIYNSFKGFGKIVPQGSPLYGIGNNFKLVSIGNCFVVSSPNDSYGSIMKTDQEIVHIGKRRGGNGFDISNIRPKGFSVNNAAQTTDGIIAFMQRYSNTTHEVAQAGGRRGALMITILCSHMQILDFIKVKRDKTKVTGANISVKFTDEFFDCLKNKKKFTLRHPATASIEEAQYKEEIDPQLIWDEFIESNYQGAEPGCLYWSNLIRDSISDCYADCGFETSATNPCFGEKTLIATDKGLFQIKDLVGEIVNVFDGNNWVSCNNFMVTGKDQDLMRVTFHDGSYIDATPYHKWNLEDGSITETKELKKGIRLKGNMNELKCGENKTNAAYLKGFLLGDGNYNVEKSFSELYIYEPKACCVNRLIESANEIKDFRKHRSDASITPYVNDLELLLTGKKKRIKLCGIVCMEELDEWTLKYKNELPNEVYTWDEKTICDFIAGLFDADGSSIDGEKGYAYQITNMSDRFLLDVQQLLKIIGIKSKLDVCKKACKKNMPGGTYNCKTSYRLTISQRNSIILSNKVKFERLKSFSDRIVKNIVKEKYNLITSVELLNGKHTVYCCNIPSTHSILLANGCITRQCGELPLPPNASCILMLLNLYSFILNPYTPQAKFDFEEFDKQIMIATRLMDDMIDLEIEKVTKIIEKIKSDPESDMEKQIELDLWENILDRLNVGRRVGLGITALADMLAALGIKYDSKEAVSTCEKIFSFMHEKNFYYNAILAKERGAFPCWDWDKEKDNNHIKLLSPETIDLIKKYGRRNISLSTIPPAGSISILTQTTSGFEPVFKAVYSRKKKISPDEEKSGIKVDTVDSDGNKWNTFNVFHHGLKRFMDITGKKFEDSPYYKSESHDIAWEYRVKMQGLINKYITHSISSTINLSKDVTKEELSSIYLMGHESGCKGLTTYRDGCRDGVLTTTKKDKEVKIVDNHAPKRPKALSCEIYHSNVLSKKSGVTEKWIFFIGILDGRPYEVFGGKKENIDIAKKVDKGWIVKNGKNSYGNSTYDLYLETLEESDDRVIIKDIASQFKPEEGTVTRMTSLSLRHGVPVHIVVEQLCKDVSSPMIAIEKCISRLLKHHIKDGIEASATEACPLCKSKLIYRDGCVSCSREIDHNCPWSRCS